MYVCVYICVCVCVCVCVSWKCSGINYVMTWFVLIALRKAKTTTCLHLSLSYPSFLSSHLYFLPYLSHIYKKKPLFRFSTISPITPLFHPLCSSSIVLFTASFTSWEHLQHPPCLVLTAEGIIWETDTLLQPNTRLGGVFLHPIAFHEHLRVQHHLVCVPLFCKLKALFGPFSYTFSNLENQGIRWREGEKGINARGKNLQWKYREMRWEEGD